MDKSIFDLSKSQIVNQYLYMKDAINKTGKLAFILKGNLAWDSDKKDGLEIDNIWLQSKHIKLGEGINFDELPINFQYQMTINIHEIWGAFKVNLKEEKKNEAVKKIEDSIDNIISLSNIMSFLTGASLQWYPAAYGNVQHRVRKREKKEDYYSWECEPFHKDGEGYMSFDIKDDFILEKVIPLFKGLESLHDKISTPINSALDWHTEANRYTAGINRFVHYWQSIELLGNYFYANLNADIVDKKSNETKKDNIIDVLGDQNLNKLNNKNFLKKIKKSYEIYNPPIRTKLLSYLNLIGVGSKYEEMLFGKNDSNQGLYGIRNDIVHGRISNRDFEKTASYRDRLNLAQKISRDIIIKSISSSNILLKEM